MGNSIDLEAWFNDEKAAMGWVMDEPINATLWIDGEEILSLYQSSSRLNLNWEFFCMTITKDVIDRFFYALRTVVRRISFTEHPDGEIGSDWITFTPDGDGTYGFVYCGQVFHDTEDAEEFCMKFAEGWREFSKEKGNDHSL